MYVKEQILDLVKETYPSHLGAITYTYPKFKKWLLLQETVFGYSYNEKVYNFIYPENRIVCNTCGGDTKFNGFGKGYGKYCSYKCCANNPETNIIRRKTCLKKYKTEVAQQCEEVQKKVRDTKIEKYKDPHYNNREKYKETNLERFGVENVFSNIDVQKKQQETVKNKYGVTNVSSIPDVKEKKKKTCLKNHGVEFGSQSVAGKEKSKKTSTKKYGVESPNQDAGVKSKQRGTMVRKYGVPYATQMPESKIKSKNTSMSKYGVESPNQDAGVKKKQQDAAYNRKPFVFPDGSTIYVQGYENIVLSDLIKMGFSAKDIITDIALMPRIWYYENGKKRKYFPDIFIPSLNWIIEVKSNWTFIREKSKNLLKRQACVELGYTFNFIIR